MYTPPHFKICDPEECVVLIRSSSFGTLVTVDNGIPTATHLPFLVSTNGDGGVILRAHMARANPQWQCFDRPGDVLAVFLGPHAYISPSYYTVSPAVPTWNYAAVHVYGPARLLDREESLDTLRMSVQEYESNLNPSWSIDSLSDDYVSGMLNGIVAFELMAERIEGKRKMSQNRSEADRENVAAKLEASGDWYLQQVAAMMKGC